MIDLHVHTWRCRHAEGTAEEYVAAAASRGIRTLAFTDHLPLAPALAASVPGSGSYAMPAAELPEYVADVRRAAAIGAETGVEVLLGIEVDAVPRGTEHAAAVLAQYRFDMVLGSVHFIDDWAFDDPALTDRYGEWDMDALWERYFQDLVSAARAGLADAIAHAVLVKKFCMRPSRSVAHLYTETAHALAEAGVAVEVNTAGLRKPCKELYPGPALLASLYRAGVPATIGSDAHSPDDVGAGTSEAVAALREAGYRSVVVFRNRAAEELALDDL